MTLQQVLDAVEGRVGYLRVSLPAPGEQGWGSCGALTAAALTAAVDDGVAGRSGADRQVVVSLFAQSYAFKIGAVSLAAYALGLPWPSPAAADTAVRLAKGRAIGLRFEQAVLGKPDDAVALVDALLARHLRPFTDVLREATTIGARLVRGNVAASCAAAFRAVEGAARDRADATERAAIRRRADDFFRAAIWLQGTGRFERMVAGDADGWYWTRTSCCLYYKISSGSTCDDCSLISAPELAARRRAELELGGGNP